MERFCEQGNEITGSIKKEFLDQPNCYQLLNKSCKRLFSLLKKAIPVPGRGGPWGCETSRLPHFLDNRLTDGGEVVSPTHRPPFTPRKIPGTRFC
jgi:hypothetical protein